MTLIIQKPTGAKLNLSKIQQYPAVLGEPWGGGYFAGYISHTANGNPTHALIVAPRATGATGSGYTLLTTNYAWKTSDTATAGTTSPFDGQANTAAMIAAGIDDHPAAQFCVNLTIGGFTDWYLPARYELEIAYFNLKPSSDANNVSWGENIYSVPRRDQKYTTEYPVRTYVDAFNTSSEAFAATTHWSSTENVVPTGAFTINFVTGNHSGPGKSGASRVRAFRRIALP